MNRILYMLLGCAISSCSNEITLQLHNEYCGNVYVISNNSIKRSNNIEIDSNGIGYINSKAFENEITIRIVKENEDISSISKNYASGILTADNKDIKYGTLYIPCIFEAQESEEYWQKKSMDRNLNNELRKLIQEGIVRVD